MTRPPSSPSTQVHGDKPTAAPIPATTAPVAPSASDGRISAGWRLALFLWAASFVFLWLYELLSAVRRALTAGD